jgi:hypothetical protein
MKRRKMKSSSLKSKGRKLQQTVVADILSAFPTLTQNDVRSTSMGAQGEDILLSEAARKLLPFSFECKNQETLNIWKAIEQARSNCDEGHTPAVVFKKNKESPHVAIPLSCFMKLVSETECQKQVEERGMDQELSLLRESVSRLVELRKKMRCE